MTLGTPEKEPKEKLWNLALKEQLRIESGREPDVSALTVICARIVEGEHDEWAIKLIIKHGTPQMVAALGEAGLLDAEAWEAWKARLTPGDAELVLQSDDAWPHEIREWASILAVSAL